MNKIVCFNELSAQPLCHTEAEANARLRNFIALIREVRNHTEITKIRHSEDLTSIHLMEGMTVQDYCNAHIKFNDPVAIALISMFVKPQIDMDDDASLQRYLDTDTELHHSDGRLQSAEGFKAAYCQGTFCVGFDSDPLWRDDFFNLHVTSNGKTKEVEWACISSLDFYSLDPQHRHRKPRFDLWLQGIRPITLLSSTKAPKDKEIELRDDHGKDKLLAHAKMLCNHPNVEGILTSLSFKPRAKTYIDKITDDGLVDIVLWWETPKVSMRVKTTGRNSTETKEIARLLKEKYGKH